MAPRVRGKQAVYIGTLPEGFKPQRLWDMPPAFQSVELYAKNLAMYQASGFARVFNKKQLENRLPDRKWAFVAKHLKSRYHGEHPEARKALEERLPGRKWAFWMKRDKSRRSGEHHDAIQARKGGSA